MDDRATPINQLRGDNSNNAELVQNILNDFENDQAQPPSSQQPQMQQQQPQMQQMPEQQMQPQQQMQQMPEQQMQPPQQQQQMQPQYYSDEEYDMEPFYQERELNTTEQIISEVKRPLLVVLLVFLSNLQMVDDVLLKNFVQLSVDGNLNMLGLLAKAVLAGVVYYLVNNFVL